MACRFCGEQILAVAKKCKHCGEILDLATRSAQEVARQTVPATAIQLAPQMTVNVAAPSQASHSLGIASLVVGILSFFVCWMPVIGLLLGGLGFALGIAGLVIAITRKGGGIGYAIAGTSVSAISLLIGITFAAMISSMFAGINKATHQTTSTRSEAQGEKSPPPAVKNWIDADKHGQKLGDIVVAVMNVKTGVVQIQSFGGDSESKEPQLTIWLTIQNKSEKKKLDYRSWASDLFSFGNDRVTLKDDAGNSYRKVDYGSSTTVKGAVGSESIYPGKEIRDALVFELPIDKIEYLELVLPGKHIGEEGELRFRIPKAMIKSQ